MKSRLPVYALIATGSLLAPLAQAAELTVTINDIRNNKGHLLVSIVDSEAGWNNQAKPVAAEKLLVAEKIDGKSLKLKFVLPAGKYALQVMHDENDNGKMDINPLGIPIEGYGYSNNPVVMRRAHFSETVFDLEEKPTAIAVILR